MTDWDTILNMQNNNKVISMDPMTMRMFYGALAKFKNESQAYYTQVAAYAITGELKSRARDLLRNIEEATELFEILLGMHNRRPTKQEQNRVKELVQENHALTGIVEKLIDADTALQDKLKTTINDYDRIRKNIPARAEQLAKRMQDRKEAFAGVKQAGRAGGSFMRGAKEASQTLPTELGGALGSTALMALAGPLAPFVPLATYAASGLWRGAMGVKNLFAGKQRNQQVSGLTSMLAGLGAEEPGMGQNGPTAGGNQGFGGMGGQSGPEGTREAAYKIFEHRSKAGLGGSAESDWLLAEKLANSRQGGGGSGFSPEIMAGAIAAGMFAFFSKDAFKAKYTHDLLEAITGQKSGTTPGGGGLPGLVKNIPWVALGKAAAGLAGLTMGAVSAFHAVQKTKEWFGQDAGVGSSIASGIAGSAYGQTFVAGDVVASHRQAERGDEPPWYGCHQTRDQSSLGAWHGHRRDLHRHRRF